MRTLLPCACGGSTDVEVVKGVGCSCCVSAKGPQVPFQSGWLHEWNERQTFLRKAVGPPCGKHSTPCLATTQVPASLSPHSACVLPDWHRRPQTLPFRTPSTQDVLGMKEQDAGLLKILGPLAGEALRLSGYDKNGISVALNPVDSRISEVGLASPFEASNIEAVVPS